MTERPLTVGSMFAGIGGFDLGAERAGMKVLWAVEKDPQARKLLRARFPDVEVLKDVTQIDPRGLRRVDVLTAGWPCQDVSVAGNRAGLAGERSGLWREVVRWLGVQRPTWFVGENVPGLLSSFGGRDMGTVLGQLGELGYGWAYRTLDARYFGVAQRRRRVLIVGCLGDSASAAQVLLEPEGREWHPAASKEAREAVAGTLGGGSGERGWAADTDRMTFVAQTLTSGGHPNSNEPGRHAEDDVNLVVPALTGQGNRQDDQETGQLVCADTLRSHPRPGSNSSGAVVLESRFARNGRGAPDTIVPPLKAQSGQSGKGDGAPLLMAQSAVRRLTPTECERLQGFPDGWTEGFADSTRYRMLGNAICVPVAEWVLGRLG